MYVIVCLCNLHCLSSMSHVMIFIVFAMGQKIINDGWICLICLFLKLMTAKHFLRLSSSCCDLYISPYDHLERDYVFIVRRLYNHVVNFNFLFTIFF